MYVCIYIYIYMHMYMSVCVPHTHTHTHTHTHSLSLTFRCTSTETSTARPLVRAWWEWSVWRRRCALRRHSTARASRAAPDGLRSVSALCRGDYSQKYPA